MRSLLKIRRFATFLIMKNSFLKKISIGFVLTAISVVISYLFLDRPIAFWMYAHPLSLYPCFEWITYIAVGIGAVMAFCLPVFAVISISRPLKKIEKIVFISSLSLAVTIFLKDIAKLIFGRYWIQTWIDQNPSLISNGAYGFHFLQAGSEYGSFPSGHTAIVCSSMTFLWFFAPKWRFIAILLVFLEVLGLIVMDYHFLSDILAGAFLGISCSCFTIQIAKLRA